MAERREAIFRIGADSSRLDGQLNTARSKLSRFGSAVKAELGASFRGAFDQVKNIAGIATVGGFAAAAKSVIDFDKRLTRLRFSAENAAEGIRVGAGDIANLRAKMYELSTTTGVSIDELLTGVEKFVEETGRIDEAEKAMESFARVQATTGASMEDIAKSAAKLNLTMHIGGSDFERVFSTIVEGSHLGSVELRNLAGNVASIAAQFQAFGTTGRAGVAEMGALFQVMARGFGSADEAATGFESLMTNVIKHADKLKRVGVRVFTKDAMGKEHVRDLLDIVKELYAKTGGQESVINHIFGRAETTKALRPLFDSLRSAPGELDKFVSTSMKSNVVSKQFAEYQNTSAFKIAQVAAELRKLATEGLAKHIDDIAKAFQMLGKAMSFALEHKGELIALWAATKSFGVFSRMGGGGLGGGVASAVGGAIGAGTPVYVTNWPGGGLGGLPGVPGGAGGAAGPGGIGLAGVGQLVTVAIAGYQFGKMLDSWLGISDSIAGVTRGEIGMEANKREGSFVRREEARVQDIKRRVASGAMTPMIGAMTMIGEARVAEGLSPGQEGNISPSAQALVGSLAPGGLSSGNVESLAAVKRFQATHATIVKEGEQNLIVDVSVRNDDRQLARDAK